MSMTALTSANNALLSFDTHHDHLVAESLTIGHQPQEPLLR